jgi:TATA-box binding protein (TBP) (component of TFIID and TFIIIB)
MTDANNDTINAMDVPPLRETNYVATGYIDLKGEKLDVGKLARTHFGVIHSPYKFSSARQILKYPRSAVSAMYKGSRISIMAGNSVPATHLAMVKAVYMLRRMGIPHARLTRVGIKVNNVVCSAHVKEGISIPQLMEQWPAAVTYDPTKFKGARVSCSVLGIEGTNIVLQVYASGKVNVVGSRSFEESGRVWAPAYINVLSTVRPNVSQSGGARMGLMRAPRRPKKTAPKPSQKKKAAAEGDDDMSEDGGQDDMDEDDEFEMDDPDGEGEDEEPEIDRGPAMYGGENMYDIRLSEALFALSNTI